MIVGAIDNRTHFQQKLKLDIGIIERATAEEKRELVKIKKMLKNNGVNGTYYVKNKKGTPVSEIIDNLYTILNKNPQKNKKVQFVLA